MTGRISLWLDQGVLVSPTPLQNGVHVRSPFSERSHAGGRPATRLTRRLVALGGSLTLTAGLLTALAPTASAADSTTDLGVSISRHTKGGDVAAGGGRIFVSAKDRIVITDDRGAITGAIDDLTYVTGLATTPDGTRLYAGLHDSNEVAEIDTATLAVTRRISTGRYPCPSHLDRKSVV